MCPSPVSGNRDEDLSFEAMGCENGGRLKAEIIPHGGSGRTIEFASSHGGRKYHVLAGGGQNGARKSDLRESSIDSPVVFSNAVLDVEREYDKVTHSLTPFL
jgi:hypothetical protein